MARNKKKANDGLDVLEEIKEPFSLARFYDEVIVASIKKIKRTLDERGILFFFLSPFQQRNRLIIQLVLIIFGIIAGVVPRGMNLLNDIRERNRQSEMASLLAKNTTIQAGSINITPLTSSCYDKQHLLAFLIEPANGAIIPATADHYFVNIYSTAVMATDVKVAYDVFPFGDDSCLMLVYTDHRAYESSSGVYNIIIENRDDNLPITQKTPMELVFSNNQRTTEFFNEDGIHLSALSNTLSTVKGTPIAEAKEQLKKALSDYSLEVERAANQRIAIHAIPSTDAIAKFVQANDIYPTVLDTSTTSDISDIEQISPEEAMIQLKYECAVEVGGTKLTRASFGSADASEENPASDSSLTEDEKLIMTSLTGLQQAINKILTAANNVNKARIAKFNSLYELSALFNETITIDQFSDGGHVTSSMMSIETEEEIFSTPSTTESAKTSETQADTESTKTSEVTEVQVDTESTETSETPTEVTTETPVEATTETPVDTEASVTESTEVHEE